MYDTAFLSLVWNEFIKRKQVIVSLLLKGKRVESGNVGWKLSIFSNLMKLSIFYKLMKLSIRLLIGKHCFVDVKEESFPSVIEACKTRWWKGEEQGRYYDMYVFFFYFLSYIYRRLIEQVCSMLICFEIWDSVSRKTNG